MFGYVRPSVQDLPEEELDRFRAMYCGLCHTLSRRYGQAARFILNYDFTYLAILLSDGTAGAQGAGRCYTSPIKKRPFLEPTAAMELAADESVILAYWQLRDGVEDHGLWKGLGYRVSAAARRGGPRPFWSSLFFRQPCHEDGKEDQTHAGDDVGHHTGGKARTLGHHADDPRHQDGTAGRHR